MKLDYVHDIQRAYRALLNAFVFPGTVQKLLDPGDDPITIGETRVSSEILLGLILLDNEVSVFFSGLDRDTVRLILDLTYADLKSPRDADFLFVNDTRECSSFEGISTGTHIDPHTGSDLLVRVEHLPQVSDMAAENAVSICGPGIPVPVSFTRNNPANDPWWWLGLRNRACSEYPLGIEVVLYDDNMNVMAFPRSTVIKEETWPM